MTQRDMTRRTMTRQTMTQRTMTRIGLIAATALLLTPLLASSAAPGRLETVLSQMDAASAKFKSAQADIKRESYERVIKETTTETGSIYFERKGNATEMGLKISPPSTRFIDYKNGVLRIFTPGTNHVTEVRAGSNQAQYESYFSLGFGGSGHDLAKTWDITDQGTDQMNDGSQNVSVEKLDLVAKDLTARTNFSHVTIWVDPTRAISLKQQFFTPSGDTQTATYTQIRYNQKVDTGPYAIKTNKSTTYDRH